MPLDGAETASRRLATVRAQLGLPMMRRLRLLLLRLRLWHKKRRRDYYDLQSDEAPADHERRP